MTSSRHVFKTDSLVRSRREFIREAWALPIGSERNQKRQIARSLKRLIDGQRRSLAMSNLIIG
jgi:hypothetical protein